jgi:hypothetical protein
MEQITTVGIDLAKRTIARLPSSPRSIAWPPVYVTCSRANPAMRLYSSESRSSSARVM